MAERSFDWVIRGGTVVTEARAEVADVGIMGDKIAAVGGNLEGRRTIDASRLLVMPGGVDPHVHLTCAISEPGEPTWCDDFTSGSQAALAGGITSIGNMTFLLPKERLGQAIEREGAQAAEQAIADVFFHPVIDAPSQLIVGDIPDLVASGHSSIKFFMVNPIFDRNVAGFAAAMTLARESGAITLVHCEDFATVRCCTIALKGQGKAGIEHFPESRPVLAEVVATQRAVALAELTGAPTYIVHLSSRRALDVCTEARQRGVPVYVETRPLYLHLTKERFAEKHGSIYVGAPPLRDPDDREALWTGLRDGTIHTLASDHAPWTFEDKTDPSQDVATARQGVADLETMLPMFYSAGVREGRITRERFVALAATNAARLFGLYPQKGTIAPGSDADIALWDPQATRRVRGDELKSRAAHTVYEGFEVTGWPVTVFRRGQIVFEDGVVVGKPGSGIILRRGPTEALVP